VADLRGQRGDGSLRLEFLTQIFKRKFPPFYGQIMCFTKLYPHPWMTLRSTIDSKTIEV